MQPDKLMVPVDLLQPAELFATFTPTYLFHAGQQCANSCCRPQSAIVRCAIVYSTALMAALYATCAGSLPCKSFFLAAPAASSTRMHSICASSLTGGLALFFATGASTASAAAAACSGVQRRATLAISRAHIDTGSARKQFDNLTVPILCGVPDSLAARDVLRRGQGPAL